MLDKLQGAFLPQIDWEQQLVIVWIKFIASCCLVLLTLLIIDSWTSCAFNLTIPAFTG